jgi:hypothetical protein
MSRAVRVKARRARGRGYPQLRMPSGTQWQNSSNRAPALAHAVLRPSQCMRKCRSLFIGQDTGGELCRNDPDFAVVCGIAAGCGKGIGDLLRASAPVFLQMRFRPASLDVGRPPVWKRESRKSKDPHLAKATHPYGVKDAFGKRYSTPMGCTPTHPTDWLRSGRYSRRSSLVSIFHRFRLPPCAPSS